jgi:hypothetical protein
MKSEIAVRGQQRKQDIDVRLIIDTMPNGDIGVRLALACRFLVRAGRPVNSTISTTASVFFTSHHSVLAFSESSNMAK